MKWQCWLCSFKRDKDLRRDVKRCVKKCAYAQRCTSARCLYCWKKGEEDSCFMGCLLSAVLVSDRMDGPKSSRLSPHPTSSHGKINGTVLYTGVEDTVKKKNLTPGWTSQFHFMHRWLQAHIVSHRCLPPPSSFDPPSLPQPPHSTQ